MTQSNGGFKPFEPWRFFVGGHQQTLAGHFFPSEDLPEGSQIYKVKLPDSDELFLRVFENSSDHVVILFHGLGSHIRADYMRRMAWICLKNNWTCVLVNHRGHGEGSGMARHITHAGRWEDTEAVLSWAHNRWTLAQIAMVGFSLSGSILLNQATTAGIRHPDLYMTVNAPLDLLSCSLNLSRGFSKLYDFRFRQKLVAKIPQAYQIPWGASVYDIDDIYTAPISGFSDREDYYNSASTVGRLHQLQARTILLSSHDDPIVGVEDYLSARVSHLAEIHLTKSGGHLGYLADQKTPLGNRRWLDYFVWYHLKNFFISAPDSSDISK